MKKIYNGFLANDYEGDYYKNTLILADDFGSGLISDIQDDCEHHGYYVQLRYYISDKEFDLEHLQEYLINNYFGLTDINIESCGCPTCGYMCVDKATVGGHDIYEELLTYIGKYCILEVDYYKSEEDFVISMRQV